MSRCNKVYFHTTQVREDDLPVVFHTLLGDIHIYKEEDGDLVPIVSEESNGVKTRICKSVTKSVSNSHQYIIIIQLHPYGIPGGSFC